MPYRAVEFKSSEFYHVYNRGHNFQPIFLEAENYLFFLRQLRRYLTPEVIDIVAYCLMPNHYHLLVYLKDDEFSTLMQRFALSYTKAINVRYGRVGSVFQGRFKAIHVDRDAYLLHLSRYIHLNPVTAGLVSHPGDWSFSSYLEYTRLRNGTLPQGDAVLSQFRSRQDYQQFVEAPDEDQKSVAHLLLD